MAGQLYFAAVVIRDIWVAELDPVEREEPVQLTTTRSNVVVV